MACKLSPFTHHAWHSVDTCHVDVIHHNMTPDIMRMADCTIPFFQGGMFAGRATFVLSILSLAPSLSPPREVPQVDRTRPQTFRATHVA